MNVALCPERLDLISLCTGGGGLDVGVELAIPDARTVCMVEREAFAVATLVSAMEAGFLAPAPVWSDVRTFDGRAWRGAVDGVIGGIPCQPHSVAGRKRGSLDARDLWSAARRIVVQSGAWFVLIENVGGMLTAGADEIAGAERVWRDLRKLGFAVEIGLFRASEVGAPHERERVFILGVADADGRHAPRGSAGRGETSGWRSHAEPAGPGSFVGDATSEGLLPAAFAGTDCRDEGAWPRHAQPQRRGGELAHADSERLEGERSDDRAAGREDARRPPGLCDGTTLEHSARDRRGERRAEYGVRQPLASTAASAERTVADTDIAELRRESPAGQQQILQRDDAPGVFPPGPGDLDRWRAIAERASDRLPAVSRHDRFLLAIRAARAAADGDPAARPWMDEKGPYGLRAAVVQEIAQSRLRSVADGMAAARIDWLRLLGNGVVPLQAAYAVRTLVARLAEKGNASATQLFGMMTEAI